MSKGLNEMSSQCLEAAHNNDPRDEQPMEIVQTATPEEESIKKDDPGTSFLVSDPMKGVLEKDPPTQTGKVVMKKKHRPPMVCGDGVVVEDEDRDVAKANASGRERLKRHRTEVAGQVWIPDVWGQEGLLKDWVDCSAFDAQFVSGRIMSARAALVAEGRRANSGSLRIENRC